jgi:hypothetical protein
VIRLDTQYRTLAVGLGGAITTNPIDVSVYFFDRAPKILNTIPVQAKFTKVNTTGTGQTVCDAPDPTVIREIDEIVIANVDTVAAAITVTLVDTQRGNTAQVVITLQTNESLTYNSGNGWNAYDANGSTKRLLPATSIPWDAPGTIGSTTPNTGAFTTLSRFGKFHHGRSAEIPERLARSL